MRSASRRLVPALSIIASSVLAPTFANAQPEAPQTSQTPPVEDDSEALEQLHRDTISTRRVLASSVLTAGFVSIAAGAVLMVPDGNDGAWRAAGINTLIFGVINSVVGFIALRGIASEETHWDETRESRRTPAGRARARALASEDERRESVGHAINLGLDLGYLGVAASAATVSQLGADHPNRWLASSVAVGVQAIFLVGVDLIGLMNSKRYHAAFIEGLVPTVSWNTSQMGSETHFGIGGTLTR